MKKILLDISHIREPYNTGIANTAFQITRGLSEHSDYKLYLLTWEKTAQFVEKNIGRQLPMLLLPESQKKYLYSKFRIKVCPRFLKRYLEEKNIDVVLTLSYTCYSYVFPKRFHQIGIVHDMQLFKIQLQIGNWLKALYFLLYSVLYYRIVYQLVSISNYVRKDIKKYSGRSSIVIYNSISKKNANEKEVVELNGKKYILDINSFAKYKNAEKLIEAFSLIKDHIPHYLYLKGYAAESRIDELVDYIKTSGASERIILDMSNRSDEEMEYLYNHADLLVSPSTMEGFGLTPIEAAIRSVPVAVSNIETLVEITDNKVATFNPYSVKSISETLLALIRNPPSRERLNRLASLYQAKYSSIKQIDSLCCLINQA